MKVSSNKVFFAPWLDIKNIKKADPGTNLPGKNLLNKVPPGYLDMLDKTTSPQGNNNTPGMLPANTDPWKQDPNDPMSDENWQDVRPPAPGRLTPQRPNTDNFTPPDVPGSVDPSTFQPLNLGFKKKPGDPEKGKWNAGEFAVGALTAFDGLLPNDHIPKHVTRPQQVYNPHQYGTGSQALDDGGPVKPKKGQPKPPPRRNVNPLDYITDPRQRLIDPEPEPVPFNDPNFLPHPLYADDGGLIPRPNPIQGLFNTLQSGIGAVGKIFKPGDTTDETFDYNNQIVPIQKQMGKSGIHIKPENKGKFNATKKKTGKSTEELTHSSNPTTKKRAVFAQNAKKWKHEDGGIIKAPDGAEVPKGKASSKRDVSQYARNQNSGADSSALYDMYEYQRRNASTDNTLNDVRKDAGLHALRKGETKPLDPGEFKPNQYPLDKRKASLAEWMKLPDEQKYDFKFMKKWDAEHPEVDEHKGAGVRNIDELKKEMRTTKDSGIGKADIDIVQEYKNAGFSDNQINFYSSPDLYHPTIKPTSEYWDGGAWSPKYQKPKNYTPTGMLESGHVRPGWDQQQQFGDGETPHSTIQRPRLPDMLRHNGPNVQAGTPGRPQELTTPASPSNYSVDEAGQVQYFPDYDTWKGYTKEHQMDNVTESGDKSRGQANNFSGRHYAKGGRIPKAPDGKQITGPQPLTDMTAMDKQYASNAKLAYYKQQLNNQLEKKDPSGYRQYFAGLTNVRKNVGAAHDSDYIHNSNYNAALSPDEVKKALGNNYGDYISSLKSVNAQSLKNNGRTLYGDNENNADPSTLAYGRRFASMTVNPAFTKAHADTPIDPNAYRRDYTFDPSRGGLTYTETGDRSLRPQEFNPGFGEIAASQKMGGRTSGNMGGPKEANEDPFNSWFTGRYAQGGPVQPMAHDNMETHWGGNAEVRAYNPYDGGTVHFNGASHDNGGIGISHAGNPVEVEGGETGALDREGNLNVFGNMYLPGTRTKFKAASKEIAEKEEKYGKMKDKGTQLVNVVDKPKNKYQQLMFNSGTIMAEGGDMAHEKLAESKERLAALQNAMLDTAAEFGKDPQKLSEGIPKKATKGTQIQMAKAGYKMLAAGGRQPNPSDFKSGDQAKDDADYTRAYYQWVQKDSKSSADMKQEANYRLTSGDLFHTGTDQNGNPLTGQFSVPQAQPKTAGKSSIMKQAVYTPPGEEGSDATNYDTTDPNDPGINDATRSDRNRNPGNIRMPDSQAYRDLLFGKGKKPKTDKDGFVIFNSRDEGERAMGRLMNSDLYKDKPVDQMIKKWTNKHPYKYQLPDDMKNADGSAKKVSELNGEQQGRLRALMNHGEGTRYGQATKTNVQAPPTAGTPDPFTKYALPTPKGWTTQPSEDPNNPDAPPLSQYQTPDKRSIPTNAMGLTFGQVAPEIYGAAMNKERPVFAQKYAPELYEPYQVSFQDQLNNNQATFNSVSRIVGSNNPAALGSLAADKYNADSSVKANEFRTNQGIENDIINKNINLENDAQVKNLGISDLQFTRQETANSKTRQENQMIVNSLSSKYEENNTNNRRLKVYEDMYNYRFTNNPEGGFDATNYNPDAVIDYTGNGNIQQGGTPEQQAAARPDTRRIVNYKNGQPTTSRTVTESADKTEAQRLKNESARRKALNNLSTRAIFARGGNITKPIRVIDQQGNILR